ncbi:MAG: UDP-N-acetylmuramate:L-alanyl-gamma-D-glutamyl-meso-diaminopimelate ligase [Gammaproteobacteria bacterium]
MNIHILGICGTFMGSLAILAKSIGHSVSGSDDNVYPPMSEQLEAAGIAVHFGYAPSQLSPAPELVVIGNALSRGNACVESVLDQGLAYTSGPQWLAEQVLRGRHVLAVSGTHGKTTASALLAWLLEAAGRAPGFLIGGVPSNFGISTRLGSSSYFVIEADEYDTAFFDKRSKFVHYRPGLLIVNNIEFDHADIFRDLDEIIRQFHHLIRTLPARGNVLIRWGDPVIARVLEMGCWTPVQTFGVGGGDWRMTALNSDYSAFEIRGPHGGPHRVDWGLFGMHNAENAVAAIAAACATGVDLGQACAAAGKFLGVRRRLERLAVINGVSVYDDFAHHPTAIQATLSALRQHVGRQRILAVLEPRSNSMKLGVHRNELARSLAQADEVIIYRPDGLPWDLNASVASLSGRCRILDAIDPILDAAAKWSRSGDHVVIMSNGGFGGIHHRLIDRLRG